MQSPRGLAASKKDDGPGNGGGEGGRHGEASPDHERKEDEDDGDVGGALEHVVGVGSRFARRRAVEGLREDAAEGAPGAVAFFGEQVAAEMAGEKAVEAIGEAGDHDDPGSLKVEGAAPAVLVGHDVVVAGRHRVARGGNGDGEEWTRHDVADFAPVEARVGDDDFSAGDEQGEEAEHGDPMGHADESRVARGAQFRWGGSGCHEGSIARQARLFPGCSIVP